MKRIFFFSILIFLLHCACENDDAINKSLIGKWQWVQSTGGIAGTTNTPESTGKNRMIEFTADSIYKSYLNGDLITESKFSIVRRKSIYDHKPTDMILLEKGEFTFSYDFESSGLLILKDEMHDGFTNIYERIE